MIAWLERLRGTTSRTNKYLYLLAFLVFITFFVNTFHADFPDEFDNILGGFYITKGILPYSGFFSHHGPFSYYLASVITIFTNNSFVAFRAVLSIVYFGFIVLAYQLIKRRVKNDYSLNYWLFALMLGLGSTYYWNQMLLADTLSGYLLIPVYGILVLKSLFNERIGKKDLLIISLFSFLTFITSITYIYVIAIIGLYTTYLYFIDGKNKIFDKNTFKFILIFAIPYIAFGLYLLLTGSGDEFYKQAILYNKNTYIYNYPRAEGSTTINPIRYAVVITYNFFNNYRNLLTQVKDFNFSFPFNITLALVNTFLLIVLSLKRKFKLGLFVLLILIFTNPRSNPLTSKETDFQSAVYITLSFFNIPLVVKLLKEEVVKEKTEINKLVSTGLFLILLPYLFFFSLYISNVFGTRAYLKYMGQEPLIYNDPQVAPLLNKLTTKDDFIWVGPLDFKELLYLNAKMPSKYHWFLRAHSVTPEINQEFITDILNNRPTIIVYKRDPSEFGQDPNSINSRLMNILETDYFQITDLDSESIKYSTNFSSRNFGLDQFYFRNDKKEELISRLISSGTISKQ